MKPTNSYPGISRSSGDFRDKLEPSEAVHLAQRMAEGVSIMDRSYHLKTYKSCFVGTEAVEWLLSTGEAESRDQAVRLGNQMCRAGLLHHVLDQHGFEDSNLFYRFHLDPWGTPQLNQSSTRALRALGTKLAEKLTLNPIVGVGGGGGKEGGGDTNSTPNLRSLIPSGESTTTTGASRSTMGKGEMISLTRRLTDLDTKLEHQGAVTGALLEMFEDERMTWRSRTADLEARLANVEADLEVARSQAVATSGVPAAAHASRQRALALALGAVACLFVFQQPFITQSGSNSNIEGGGGDVFSLSTTWQGVPLIGLVWMLSVFFLGMSYQKAGTFQNPKTPTLQASEDINRSATRKESENAPKIVDKNSSTESSASLDTSCNPGAQIVERTRYSDMESQELKRSWSRGVLSSMDGADDNVDQEIPLRIQFDPEVMSVNGPTVRLLEREEEEEEEKEGGVDDFGEREEDCQHSGSWKRRRRMLSKRKGVIGLNSEGEAEVDFETRLFRGRMRIRIRRPANSKHSSSQYFQHRARKSQILVRGYFKEEVQFREVVTGQEFPQPLINIPPKWIQRLIIRLATNLNPTLQVLSNKFGKDSLAIYSPLAASAQAMHVEESKDEQTLQFTLPSEGLEDTHLLGKDFFGPTGSSAKNRRKFFCRPENLIKYKFKPGVLYTFDTYQHTLDLSTLELELGVKLRLMNHLNNQPLLFMAKVLSADGSHGPKNSNENDRTSDGHLWRLEFNCNTNFRDEDRSEGSNSQRISEGGY